MTDTNTRWRKKPVVIDAVQFTGFSDEHDAWQFSSMPVPEWLHDAFNGDVVQTDLNAPHDPLAIHTLEGVMRCDKGDWIIRGVKDEIYPCKPDIFEATYEPANEDRGIVPTPGDEVANQIADYYDSEADAHLRYSIRNAALAFAIQNQGKGGDPKKLVEAAKTFTAFLEAMNGATDPVMPELKPTLKMRDGSEPPPHVARMIDEYLELDDRRKKLGNFIGENPVFDSLSTDEREAMIDQHIAMEDYYAALMRRLAYAGAMTS